jgi:hypothetical protein
MEKSKWKSISLFVTGRTCQPAPNHQPDLPAAPSLYAVVTYSLRCTNSYRFGHDLADQGDIKYDLFFDLYNKLYHLNWLPAQFSSEAVRVQFLWATHTGFFCFGFRSHGMNASLRLLIHHSSNKARVTTNTPPEGVGPCTVAPPAVASLPCMAHLSWLLSLIVTPGF